MVEQDRASWLWARLRGAVPDALSCVLMPDHLHLEAPPGRKDPLRHALIGYERKFGVRLDLAEAEPANSAAILFRQVRYQLFNPRREGLVDDPWAWRWSTLRDLGGVCVPVWTGLSRVASALELPPRRALGRLTAIGDFRAPELMAPSFGFASLEAVLAAVAAALRCSTEEVLRRPKARRLVIQTCYAVGRPHAPELAERLGCGLRTIFRARTSEDEGLDAVLRCLADQRLVR